ncbi:hypothetical protein HOP50_07g47830 [Chloropicon primus]|uniref:Uncharacterized protein n=1 Tax=Chloropicon primus TaxID=1764295 RepID=A0A5B8MNY7_9CHLO|nr:hypothetical protein A3770_07p47610 [Chloropicon primus]UPR01461.1 hypothetical protein HOP50_07g47830 [Chloropicon primus]|eukprot:QDZ22243.1 hypothetical protein A3770_07p47610 [Chloropicon primus]
MVDKLVRKRWVVGERIGTRRPPCGGVCSPATGTRHARRPPASVAALRGEEASESEFHRSEGGHHQQQQEHAEAAPRPRTARVRSKVSEARSSRFRRRGKGNAETQSAIRSELNRFESAFDRFEREGEKEARWHVVSIAGAKREESYSKKLLEAYEKELKKNRKQYTLPDGSVQAIQLMTPVIRYVYKEVETGKAVKRTVRWPASDVIWCHCVLNTKMKAFLNRQSFVRNIFSGEPLVNLSDFAFQDEYDVARDQDEGTLLSFTDMLKHARRVEEHRIEDPAEVGLDVHSQLTELFQRKYGSRAEGESLEEDDSILSPM